MIKRIYKISPVIFLCICLQLFFQKTLSFAEQIDYSAFDNLLKKYVSRGAVDYVNWKNNDFQLFESYIKGLEDVSLQNLELNEKKSFWINTYNALTIYAVLKRIPSNALLARVFTVQVIPGFFDKITYSVAGESITLNDIENEKLRKEFNDARTHFAIVCASRSCPKIQNTIFAAINLDARLKEATRLFIQDAARNRLDKDILYLSQIFKWYAKDFEANSGSIIDYVKEYSPQLKAQNLSGSEQSLKIKYLYYDWLVNIKR